MSMTLYQLADEYQHALDNVQVDASTGEIVGFEEIEHLEAQYDQKAINCALYLKSLKAEVEAIKAEETVLRQRRQSAEKKTERIRQYIEGCMNSAGKEIIQDPRVRLSFRCSKRVQILDQLALPAKYLKIKAEPVKSDIANAIKAGIAVPGAELVGCRSLQIK